MNYCIDIMSFNVRKKYLTKELHKIFKKHRRIISCSEMSVTYNCNRHSFLPFDLIFFVAVFVFALVFSSDFSNFSSSFFSKETISFSVKKVGTVSYPPGLRKFSRNHLRVPESTSESSIFFNLI